MEPWLMECFGFYCVAVGVGVIVFLCVKALLYLFNYQENLYLKELEKTVNERDEQIEGLRSIIDRLKKEDSALERENNK